ncbi:BA75_03035T0 [Komagataella pastoris]|uniref:BA75_03035T0 n=1 Tax=Komagataella pastoris TaxID=4922 RepID=A0A1B2JDJ4_PICPA|nr:BA75_03035T0 [Komagataella pastoris]
MTEEIQEPVIPGNYSARKQTRWEKLDTVKGKKAVHLDGIHDSVDSTYISPGQLYSTESGRMFHAGQVCVCICGQPARGKTNLSISLCRYLRWLGLKSNLFHMGNYRRAKTATITDDFFKPVPDTEEAFKMRKELTESCVQDMKEFFQGDHGQVAIYDAVNAISKERVELVERMKLYGIRVLFIESLVTDDNLLRANIQDASKSPDYQNWDSEQAVEDYKKRVDMVAPHYQEMNEPSLSYVKFINFGERLIVKNSNHDFLTSKIVFFLMNSKIKRGSVYMARCSNNKLSFKSDPPLTEAGREYSQKVMNTVLGHISKFKGENFYHNVQRPKIEATKRQPAYGVDGQHENSLVVWTSVRRRTVEAAQMFKDLGITTRHRQQLTQLNPGDAEGLTLEELREKFPHDYEEHLADPYHHRYPRAESYHDLAVKVEPLLFEMERMRGDVLIIADETVLRVLYGYLMACHSYDIPTLKFPENEVIQITYNAYTNTATRIPVEGLEQTED